MTAGWSAGCASGNAVETYFSDTLEQRCPKPRTCTRRSRRPRAVSLVRLDGEVSASILGPIRGIPAITEAKLLRLGKS